jgi:hypothetical protein
MQDPLTTTLQMLYEANLRCLQIYHADRTVSTRILNTNDYIINTLTSLLSRNHGISLPSLNSEETTHITIPELPPLPPIFMTSRTPGLGLGLFHNFNDPVPVYPSPAQIQEGTVNLLFSSIENPMNDACPISLNAFHRDEVVTQIRGCAHVFNQAQLGIWFRSNCRCPVCRFDIRTYVAQDDLSEEQNAEAMEEYESRVSENATAILNLLSNPNGGDGVVRDLSGNRFIIRSFFDT